MLPAPPVVVDADVLLRNVDYGIRKGYDGALIDAAIGVNLFVATEVRAEVERHLPEIAARRRVAQPVVDQAWERLASEKLRFVSLRPDIGSGDPRLSGVDGKDLPSARLACVLAPAVLATDNRRHFRGLVTSESRTDHVALDLLTLARLDVGARGVVLPSTLATALVAHGAKELAARTSKATAVAVGLALVAGVALAVSDDRARHARERLADVGAELGPRLSEFLVLAQAASERVNGFAVAAGETPLAVSVIARRLLRRHTTLTTTQVADLLRDADFSFGPASRHASATRAWLVSEPCFVENPRGHWSFGHLERP